MYSRGFLGVVPTTLIETIVDICRPQDWPAIYVACSGTFRTERGLLTKFRDRRLEVQSNDVSLLSTALGRAGRGERFRFQFKGELAWIEELGLSGAEDRIAAILLGLTYSSFVGGNRTRFKDQHLEHMRAHFAEYVESTSKTVLKILRAMPISGYFAGDFRDHIEMAIDRGAGVIAYPPTFKGGYEKLFAFLHANVEWSEPKYRVFDPQHDVKPVLERLHASGIPYFLYLDQEVDGFEPTVRFQARGKRDIFGYGRAAASSWRASKSSARPFVYDPIVVEQLTEQSRLAVLPVPEANISFLREAFLKRGIAYGTGDYGVLVFLDHMLVGAISYRKLMGTRTQLFVLTDLVITREGRLAKLVARAATCREVFEPFEHQQLTRYDRISTTVFSDHPESMKYRGSWKVHSREEIDGPAGRYKVSYVSDVRTETLAECYAWWWRRDGAKQVAQARSRAPQGRSADAEAA
jgi:hypothetical protein